MGFADTAQQIVSLLLCNIGTTVIAFRLSLNTIEIRRLWLNA